MPSKIGWNGHRPNRSVSQLDAEFVSLGAGTPGSSPRRSSFPGSAERRFVAFVRSSGRDPVMPMLEPSISVCVKQAAAGPIFMTNRCSRPPGGEGVFDALDMKLGSVVRIRDVSSETSAGRGSGGAHPLGGWLVPVPRPPQCRAARRISSKRLSRSRAAGVNDPG